MRVAFVNGKGWLSEVLKEEEREGELFEMVFFIFLYFFVKEDKKINENGI